MKVLQKCDPFWKTKIRVRPFVNLICKCNKNGQRINVYIPRICAVENCSRIRHILINLEKNWKNYQEAIVSIGLN